MERRSHRDPYKRAKSTIINKDQRPKKKEKLMSKTEVKGGELVVAGVSNYSLVKSDIDFASTLEENLGDTEIGLFDLRVLKVPSGGGINWEIEDSDAEGGLRSERFVEGVIVNIVDVRNYWKTGMDEEGASNTPPDCFSYDLVNGFGVPGGLCANCEYSKFGSGKNGSQACKHNRLVFVMMEDSVLPTIIKAPPTSIKPIKKYMMDLIQKGIKRHCVVTKFSLKKVTAQGKPAYAEIEMRPGDKVDAAHIPYVQKAVESSKKFADYIIETTVSRFNDQNASEAMTCKPSEAVAAAQSQVVENGKFADTESYFDMNEGKVPVEPVKE